MTTKQMATQVRLEHWGKVLRERKSSGLSIRRWCRENGINEKTYYYWQRKLRESVCESLEDQGPEPLLPATFAQVQMPKSEVVGGKIVIHLNGTEVEIYGDMPVDTVNAVLSALLGQ